MWEISVPFLLGFYSDACVSNRQTVLDRYWFIEKLISAEFEKMLLINIEILEILAGKSIWGNMKLELSVSITLPIESESSNFNKLISKSPNKKFFLENSFYSLNDNGEIKPIVNLIIWSIWSLYICNLRSH